MDDVRLPPDGNEAELLEAACAAARAGKTVPEEEVDAWIATLGTVQERPPPRAKC